MTVCVYLPDNTVGFMFKRPEIMNNDAHHAGGLKFEVVEPSSITAMSYAGQTLYAAGAVWRSRRRR